jgi:hypothetical protein
MLELITEDGDAKKKGKKSHKKAEVAPAKAESASS